MTVLIALAMTGCTTVKTEYVAPECEVPELATLPPIKSNSLDSVSDETFWALQTRERRLTDWALDMEAQLEVLCEEPKDGEED